MRTATHVALLRGINVGGRNKLAMKKLAETFEAVGAGEVRTYIQSGNVVFAASAALARRIPAAIESALAQRTGLVVPVILRSATQLRAVAAKHPLHKRGVDPRLLHVAFLSRKPLRGRVSGLDTRRSPPDTFVVVGSEIYLCCPNGMARTKLTNDYFDAKLGLISTMRTWNTVRKLVALCDG